MGIRVLIKVPEFAGRQRSGSPTGCGGAATRGRVIRLWRRVSLPSVAAAWRLGLPGRFTEPMLARWRPAPARPPRRPGRSPRPA